MADFWIKSAWLIPLLPLVGAGLAALGPKRVRLESHLPVIAGIGFAFLVSLGTLLSARPEATVLVCRWLTITGLDVPIEFRVDGLTTVMLSMVTFVSTLVAVFASGYMKDDPAQSRFFALIGLFVASMTGLVLSNNYLLTYVFWEGVGVCSYLLIGFWYTRPSAASAAMKAFLVNRIGDFGFAIAIFWMWSIAPQHDLSYGTILNRDFLQVLPHDQIVGIALLLFWAATAKSAQIPLYVWLPDAMEGPTPVSALIHAATMVTAGVYLIARSTPMLVFAPGVQLTVAITGCATALLSAAIAVTQTDLKRVLAYSTVSQLGYMFMALGSGVEGVAQLAVIAAMFHLFTHAFFKALLFLAAGSVMHAMGDVIDMRRFGGLRHRLPYTCATFAVGGLALAGIFPLAGFFSKDEILLAVGVASREAKSAGWVYSLIYCLALFTAFLTAFYTARAFFWTFWGPEKLPSPDDPEAPKVAAQAHGHEADAHGHGHHEIGHESPAVMTYPLMALAGCTVLIGLVCLISWPFGGPSEWFAHQLEATLSFEDLSTGTHGFSWWTAFLGTLAGIGGIALGYRLYAQPSPIPGELATRLKPLYQASLNKFKIDEIYDVIVVRPIQTMASLCDSLDSELVDRLVLGTARLPRWLARGLLARYQNGLLQSYAAVLALTVVVLLLVLMFS